MTRPDPGRETRIVEIRGRSVVVRQLVDAQLMMMNREARLLQKEDVATTRKMEGMDRMFRIMESAIVQPEDRDYVDELIVDGGLELAELMSFITVFADEEVPAKPKVRRGRPAIKS